MGSRYRQKEHRVLQTFTKVMSDGSSIVEENGMVLTPSLHEYMWDVVGNPFPGMNPVTHLKYKFQGGGSPQSWHKEVRLPFEGPIFVKECSYSCCSVTLPLISGAPSEAEMSDFLWESFIKACTAVPEEVSIANFLWEIREEIRKILTNLAEYLRKWMNPAGGYLGYQFGLKQTIADLKKIKNILKSAKKRLEYLRRTFGKPNPQRFRKKLKQEDFIIEDPPPCPFDYGDAGPATVYPYLKSRVITLHGTLVTYHEFPGLYDAMALLDVMGAQVGLQNPLKIIWNAIPFSWLFDYFVDTGNFFDKQQLPSFKGEVAILASCHGYKVEETYQLYQWIRRPTPEHPGGLDEATKVGQLVATKYIRRQGFPLGNIVHLTEGLSTHQLSILSALFSVNAWRDFIHGKKGRRLIK